MNTSSPSHKTTDAELLDILRTICDADADTMRSPDIRTLQNALKSRLLQPSPAPGAGGVPTREEWAAWYDEFLGPCVGSPEALERIRQRRDATNLKFADAILQRLSPSTGLDGVGVDIGNGPHGPQEEI